MKFHGSDGFCRGKCKSALWDLLYRLYILDTSFEEDCFLQFAFFAWHVIIINREDTAIIGAC